MLINLRTCFIEVGGGKFFMDSIFSGSVLNPPSPIMYPRYFARFKKNLLLDMFMVSPDLTVLLSISRVLDVLYMSLILPLNHQGKQIYGRAIRGALLCPLNDTLFVPNCTDRKASF